MMVLSLFDGMSCGRIALEKAGIPVELYYSSEVDPYAIKVANTNYPMDKWLRLGDVRNIDSSIFPKIDLLIGGSPCQSFSFAGKRKGMATKCDVEVTTLAQYLSLKDEGFEFQGQSYLFWEYMRILKEVKPTYFLLENVVMTKKWEKVLTEAMGVEPIMINSALVSAQNRKRLYWTNIPNILQPEDRGIFLKDILEDKIGIGGAMRGRYLIDGKCQDHKMETAGLTTQRLELRDDGKPNALTTVQKDTLVVLKPCTPKSYDPSATCHHVADATDLKGHDIIKRVYGENGKSPTLTANNGGNQEPKVLINKKYYEKFNKISKNNPGYLGLNCNGKGGNKSGAILGSYAKRNGGENYGTDTILKCDTQEGIFYRKLTPLECERLQTVPDNYTSSVSNSQRYKMLGNGWTVDVIAHIFKGLK